MSSLGGDRSGVSWSPKNEAAFHRLLRQLTIDPFQGHDRKSELSSEKDVEKGPLNSHEPFNLRDYLTSSNEANKAAGIPPKHVGVTWEDLQVVIQENKDDKVSVTFVGIGRVTLPLE